MSLSSTKGYVRNLLSESCLIFSSEKTPISEGLSALSTFIWACRKTLQLKNIKKAIRFFII
jgi:hypothetical protein